MDSLLANYASSDDERDEDHARGALSHNAFESTSSETSGDPSILPQPKPSSLFFSLPPPNSYLPGRGGSKKSPSLGSEEDERDGREQQLEDSASVAMSRFGGNRSSAAKYSLMSSLPEPKSSHSALSSLPPPKSNSRALPNPSTSNPIPKTIVQFKPPINPSSFKGSGVDEDDEDEVRKPAKGSESSSLTPSVKSFLSSIPAPKNSSALGALPSLGSGRRSIVDAGGASSVSDTVEKPSDVVVDSNVEDNDGHWVGGSSSASLECVSAPSETVIDGGAFSSEHYSTDGSYEGYDYSGQYEGSWTNDLSVAVPPDGSGMAGSAVPMFPKKRGRNELPVEIVEVKQDELVKNRPREDQVKLTGIAFGPSYQPVSTKGKPSKLHKRKHQIGSLYFDMKQKETELAERRAKGFLTKAETQAKYGW